MPIETRPSDTFSRDNLLIGFSVVEFTPAGGSGVPLGILSGESLEKTVETLQLQDGSSGTLTVDREIISSFEANLSLELFNFRADIAQYIFGAASLTAINPGSTTIATAGENFTLPSASGGFVAEDIFVNLGNGRVDEAQTITVGAQPIVDEAVGTGDGTSGSVSGDFSLDYKVNAIGDVTSVTVNAVAFTVVASFTAGNEVIVSVGATATSGDLQFGVGGVAADVTGDIVASYDPGFTYTLNTDFIIDPIPGRIRMLAIDGATDSLRGGQPMDIGYTYDTVAGNSLQPFTSLTVEGSATVKQLTDIGINFLWTIPSVTIRVTDDALTFGADDFATATLQMNINDAGSPNRFGTMELYSEPQASA